VKIGDQAHITARSLTLEGEGVAEHEGRQILCPGLFPSEVGLVRVESLSRQHPRAHARLLSLEAPHPARRVAACANHVARGGRCHGCALMELEEEAQREAKRALLSERYGLGVERVEGGGSALGYRRASKRVALGRAGALALGSYARGSHAPAPMTGCLVDHPRLREAFDRLAEQANALAVVPFDERTRTGDLRYVWGKTDGDRVVLTLITAARESRAARLLPAHAAPGTSLCHSVQPAAGNQMRGSPPELLCGSAELGLTLLGVELPLGALGFLQPNPEVAERAYAALVDLHDFAGARELAFDLYAGAGATTRHLRRSFARVLPCEAYPESASGLGVEPEDAGEFLARARRTALRPDLIIANPPRKGLGARVCQELVDLAPRELRIMSCGPEGLARDLAQLSPGFRLRWLRAFDTLPQTPHVELVACLERRAP
jgi:23S rRNA (uracil1939-C5)-methyltransferase